MAESTPGCRHRRIGFSLIELLVVVSIIVLLVALFLPSLQQVRRTSQGAVCLSNLSQLHQAMRGIKGLTGHTGLPNADAWVAAIASRGGGPAAVCPLDEEVGEGGATGAEAFADLSLVQWEHSGHPDAGHITSVLFSDIIAGNGLSDPQVSWFRSDGLHRGSQLNGEAEFMSVLGVSDWSELQDGIIAVSVDWSGRFTIDLNKGVITVYHKWGGDPNGGGSRHFIYNLEGEVAEIGGGKHTHTNNTVHMGYTPPLEITGAGIAISYGMNTHVLSKFNRPSQIMLMDYEKSLVDVDAAGFVIDDLDEHFAPRHFGKANVRFIDGHVELMTQSEIELEDNRWLADDLP